MATQGISNKKSQETEKIKYQTETRKQNYNKVKKKGKREVDSIKSASILQNVTLHTQTKSSCIYKCVVVNPFPSYCNKININYKYSVFYANAWKCLTGSPA